MHKYFLNVLEEWYTNHPFLIAVLNVSLSIASIWLIVRLTELDLIGTEWNLSGVSTAIFFADCVYIAVVLGGMSFFALGVINGINEYDEMRPLCIVMPTSIFALTFAFNEWRKNAADTTQSELGGIDVDKSKTDSEYVKKLANDIELWLTHRIGARS